MEATFEKARIVSIVDNQIFVKIAEESSKLSKLESPTLEAEKRLAIHTGPHSLFAHRVFFRSQVTQHVATQCDHIQQ